MSKKVDLWMPIYIGDYLSATTRLSTEQHGAYLLLIMDYWKHGSLPNDDRVLAQITRMTLDAWSNARSILEGFFEVTDKHWIHTRIEKELESAKTNKDVATKRAKAGAEARWGNKNASSNAQAMPEQSLGDATSPSPSPIKEKKNTSTEFPHGFEKFWEAYDKRKGKQNAVREWRKHNPDAETVDKIIAQARLYARNTELKYRKDPERWLKGKHWEDEVQVLNPLSAFADVYSQPYIPLSQR